MLTGHHTNKTLQFTTPTLQCNDKEGSFAAEWLSTPGISCSRPNSITLSSLVAGRKPARELASKLDSVMEFGLQSLPIPVRPTRHHSANLTLFLQLHVLNIVALAHVGWFWELQLEYKIWEWERCSYWYKNVYGNAVPTQKYLRERRSHAFPLHYTPAHPPSWSSIHEVKWVGFNVPLNTL